MDPTKTLLAEPSGFIAGEPNPLLFAIAEGIKGDTANHSREVQNLRKEMAQAMRQIGRQLKELEERLSAVELGWHDDTQALAKLQEDYAKLWNNVREGYEQEKGIKSRLSAVEKKLSTDRD